MFRFGAVVAVVVVVAVAMLAFGLHKYGRFDLSAANGGEIAERYRLVCGAYPDVALDKSKIPEHLAELVPVAARYGHGIAVLRADCVSRLSASEISEIIALVDRHRAAIDDWLGRFPTNFPAAKTRAFRELISIRDSLRPAIASDQAV